MSSKIKKNRIGAKSNRVIIGAIAAVAILLFGVFTYFAQKTLETEAYYELNQPVMAKQAITPDMVTEKATKKGTKPTNAISLADISSGYAQAKYALDATEVLTYGNVGGGTTESNSVHDNLLRDKEQAIEDGVSPEEYQNWVVTSFTVSAENAVNGRVHPGDYFDIMIVSQEGVFYPFINMKSLDSSASDPTAGGTGETDGGYSSEYLVKLSPKDAARLQWLVSNYSNIQLVLNDKSDINSKGESTDPDAGGSNRYDGWNAQTGGPYNPYGIVSPNINVDTTEDGDQGAQEDALSILATEQAERMNEARASENEESDTETETETTP